MSITTIELLSPTNRTVEGPRLRHDQDRLVVEYDCQGDDGAVEWRRIVFGEVLTLKYRQVSCCSEKSVIGASQVRSTNESSELAAALERWNESVGWQEWHQKRGGGSRFKHYTLFFDDAGCLDVIAASCDVE
jgi:hypothetical protein